MINFIFLIILVIGIVIFFREKIQWKKGLGTSSGGPG
jgi:Sec-independent protein translocase protein TatA